MPYQNLTIATIDPFAHYINSDFVEAENTNFLKREVLSRGAYVVLVPSSFITCALDTLIGLGTSLVSFSSCGTHLNTFRVTHNHLISSKQLLVDPYIFLLLAINPKSEFSFKREDGLVHHRISQSLKLSALEFRKSDNFLKKEVASRLTYALLALASLVTRAVDGAMGILVGTFSITTCGAF
jgi:hypothetical protein